MQNISSANSHRGYSAQAGRAEGRTTKLCKRMFVLFSAFSIQHSAFYSLSSAAEREKGVLPEVVIKGGERRGVESKKPPLKFDFDSNEPVQPFLETDADILEHMPSSINIIRARSPQFLASASVFVPWRKYLAGDPATVFYPLREILRVVRKEDLSTGWEVVVVDARGQAFKRFLGEKLPPYAIPWDGRGDNGQMVQVGQPYNYVVTYKDSRGKTRTALGRAFSFDGLVYQLDTSVVLSLSANQVFDRRMMSEVVSSHGEELLDESVVFIKRYHPGAPLRVEATAKDLSRAEVWSAAVVAHLEKGLQIPPGQIAVHTQREFSPIEKIDIIMRGQ